MAVKKVFALITLGVLGGLLGFVVAGCGSGKAVSLGPPPHQTRTTTGSDVTTRTGSSTPTPTGTVPASLSFEVWFVRGEQLVPTLRTHGATPRVATAALGALLAGPTRTERASGIATAIPAGTRPLGISIRRGVATVDLTSEYQSGGGSFSMQVRLGQVVYTLTQFPTVKAVRFQLDGAPVNVFSSEGIVLDHPVDRSDYKDLSPIGSPVAGSWRPLPAAPITVDTANLASVWTGRQMLVFGNLLKPVNVAAAYDATADTWRRLARPLGPMGAYLGNYSAVWTGKEMLVWGAFDYEAFNPVTNHWRRLPRRPGIGHAGGAVVWTGREMIGWGGGCCGDAFSDGVAFSPATNTWRELAPSPLAGSQHPTGAWTGRELIIFVGDLDPDGNPWPARLARAAAYNPATDTWRRLPPMPAARNGASAVWDGRDVLVVGGSAAGGEQLPAVGFAYNPARNSWRQLPPMESGRIGAAVVWTGKRLLVWGGGTGRAGSPVIPPHGLSYDPKANRWSPLPRAPLRGRLDPTAVWTGHAMIVWGGSPAGSGKPYADGAVFTPAER
jgi:spore germination protein GerM/N-acetylneuraminic acid mutarotase